MKAAIPDRNYSIQDTARLLGMGPKRLFAVLREEKLLNNDNLPFRKHIDKGWFGISTGSWIHPQLGERIYSRATVTSQGILTIQQRLEAKRKTA